MDTQEALARFEAERQALARMDHPCIARVLDAGATESGRPYFAMELCPGAAITRFCDERALSIEERLRLFLDTCAAVNHAHQKGVVHRDIKPSNVLVALEADGTPIVKVIDFGVAKAIHGRLTDSSLVTQQEQWIGTPAYMSPEQVSGNGADADTRCDVYALGALLYELLVGTTPFDARTAAKAGYDEMKRLIRDVVPPRPSTRFAALAPMSQQEAASARRTSPARMRQQVAADLDWVVMKALEKDRERRYDSAEALAQDVRRFLENQPVLAKPPGFLYVMGKFARRHRKALAAGVAFLALMALATVGSAWMAVRARRAETLANERLEQAVRERNAKEAALRDAEAVSTFRTEAFRRTGVSYNGRDVKLADALDTATQRLSEALKNQPERLTNLQATIAKTYEELVQSGKALELWKAVVETRRKTLGPTHPDTLAALRSLHASYTHPTRWRRARHPELCGSME